MTISGYLDLLQNELRNPIIHRFASAEDLMATPGQEGQIASTDESLYIYTSGVWRRIADEDDIAFIFSELARGATSFTTTIPLGATSPFEVTHAMVERPLVTVTDTTGVVLEVGVRHVAEGQCHIEWQTPLPFPCVVMCVGRSVSVGGSPVGVP